MNYKIKVKEFIINEELRSIHLIVKDVLNKFGKGEINEVEASNKLWWGKDIVEWRKRNETELKLMFEKLSSILHPMILDGYKKILNPPFANDIKIPVVFGTQLGLVRENNLIKWDDDMDVLMDIHDLYDNKNEIVRRCKKNKWIYHSYSFFNNEYEIEGKGSFMSKLFSKKKIILDFHYFTTIIVPSIDIFHGIKVDDDLKYSDINVYTSELFNFYHKKHRDYSSLIINSKTYKEKAPIFWNIINNGEYLIDEIKLSDATKKLHNKNSNSIMHINISSPKLILGKYYKNKTIELNEMNFLISDNWEEQLENEYGNWKKPRIDQFHFLNINGIKLKK